MRGPEAMYRNDYDTDVTTWAPQGRLWQVTYAMEAVKQGSVCLGLVSDKYAVLGAYKRCVCAVLDPLPQCCTIRDITTAERATSLWALQPHHRVALRGAAAHAKLAAC